MTNDGINFDELLDYRTTIRELLLLAAILTRAILDAVKGEERKEALLWLWKNDEDVPFDSTRTGFTFLEICDALELDAAKVRRDTEALMIESDRRKVVRLQALIESINEPTQTVA